MASQPSRDACDVVVRTEITIDRPARLVWPYLLDVGSWMAGLRFRTISGAAGEEGQVRLVTAEGESLYRIYFITTVHVRPFERYVLKVTSGQGTDYFGFAAFNLTEYGDRTHLLYDIYLELKVTAASAEERRRISEAQCAYVRAEVDGNNEALKRLVESR